MSIKNIKCFCKIKIYLNLKILNKNLILSKCKWKIIFLKKAIKIMLIKLNFKNKKINAIKKK